ncbi:hypothetical protein MJI20_31325, partial [Salmonella enterica subsp. enterica serovar Anatum]|nr:hypothetical protein [Salmonella enterica subsp. enterica serovar Anatum]
MSPADTDRASLFYCLCLYLRVICRLPFSMQRLEQLVGKELFARHGRNKLLTEHGIQLLGYARKILRFNDE